MEILSQKIKIVDDITVIFTHIQTLFCIFLTDFFVCICELLLNYISLLCLFFYIFVKLSKKIY